jgi:hypothetical protein
MKEHDMKRTDNTARLIPLGRVSTETRAIKGSEPELSNPVLVTTVCRPGPGGDG